ncbi:MAG: aspartyl protease family protein [Chloroflexi bacterium]|nr:aspartyl protease family protein [Chloroflexota bacterium]
MIPDQYSFTTKYNGIATALITPCAISAAWDPLEEKPEPVAVRYQCLWDTGATISAVTKRVATDLGLATEALIPIQHAGGVSVDVPQHYVNLQLPNNVVVVGRAVAQLPLTNYDVLIGMDIISQGDLAISNFNGKTTFTFRMPSVKEFDFVAEWDAIKKSQQIDSSDEAPNG